MFVLKPAAGCHVSLRTEVGGKHDSTGQTTFPPSPLLSFFLWALGPMTAATAIILLQLQLQVTRNEIGAASPLCECENVSPAVNTAV